MSKISSIYYSTKYWFRAGSRKGKTRQSIEDRCSGPGTIFGTKKMKKVGVANKKFQQHTDEIKKLSNEERLKRINENRKSSK